MVVPRVPRGWRWKHGRRRRTLCSPCSTWSETQSTSSQHRTFCEGFNVCPHFVHPPRRCRTSLSPDSCGHRWVKFPLICTYSCASGSNAWDLPFSVLQPFSSWSYESFFTSRSVKLFRWVPWLPSPSSSSRASSPASWEPSEWPGT